MQIAAAEKGEDFPFSFLLHPLSDRPGLGGFFSVGYYSLCLARFVTFLPQLRNCGTSNFLPYLDPYLTKHHSASCAKRGKNIWTFVKNVVEKSLISKEIEKLWYSARTYIYMHFFSLCEKSFPSLWLFSQRKKEEYTLFLARNKVKYKLKPGHDTFLHGVPPNKNHLEILASIPTVLKFAINWNILYLSFREH